MSKIRCNECFSDVVQTGKRNVLRAIAQALLSRLSARERAKASQVLRVHLGSDAEAVVGPSGLVWGIEGLRVVDASIFPTIPRANTHFPVLMAAEKIADLIKAEWK